MPTYTDQTGNILDLPATPRRIISLVPSQTEFLFDLGLDTEVIGITKFCIHPQNWFRHKTRVGGTKTIHLELALSLQPDLVIANKEENTAEQVFELIKRVPVWTSDINNLEDALDMMTAIGIIMAKQEKAENICARIRSEFDRLPRQEPHLRTAYLIWKDPYMAVGGDTFIHDMLGRCGFNNIFSAVSRYPETSIPELKSKDLDVLLLSSEPYPFSEKHLGLLQEELPGTRILLVNGEYFSWYGSRLLLSPEYFLKLE